MAGKGTQVLMACKGQQQTLGSRTAHYLEKFKEADINGDGVLSIFEFQQMMRRAGSKMSDRQIAETFLAFDGPRGDKRMTLEEFCAGCERLDEFERKIRELFQELDTSGDGQLQREELRVLLDRSGRCFSQAELDSVFRLADKNGDNSISLDEFVQACT